jgi:hypothetical protein
MIGLTVSIVHNFTFQETSSDGSAPKNIQMSSLQGAVGKNQIRAEVRAMNVAISPDFSGDPANCEPLNGDLKNNNPYLLQIRRELMAKVFTPDELNDWDQNKDLLKNGAAMDQARKDKLLEISSYMTERN